jgi:hypothetical protein
MKTRKIIGAVLAASMLAAMAPTTASATVYVPPHFKYIKHVKHMKHMKHVKHVKSHGGGHHSSATPWYVIGCAAGIVFAALAANARDNRELTAEEAWSCGTLFLLSTPGRNDAPLRVKG